MTERSLQAYSDVAYLCNSRVCAYPGSWSSSSFPMDCRHLAARIPNMEMSLKLHSNIWQFNDITSAALLQMLVSAFWGIV